MHTDPHAVLTAALTEESLDHFTGEDRLKVSLSSAQLLPKDGDSKAEPDGLPVGTGHRQPGRLAHPPSGKQKGLSGQALGECGEGFFCLWKACLGRHQEATCLHPEPPFLGPNPTVMLHLTGETSGRWTVGPCSSTREGEGFHPPGDGTGDWAQ